MMKIEKLQKTVDFWRTEDGLDFNSEEAAIDYAKRTEGTRRPCPNCEGKGRVPTEDFRSTTLCDVCGGKGYQDKVEQWT